MTHCCYFGEASSTECNDAALEYVQMVLKHWRTTDKKANITPAAEPGHDAGGPPLTVLPSSRFLVAATEDLRNEW